jgi:TolB-like protein
LPAEADAAPEPLASDKPSEPGDDEKKKKKKVRSPGISFVGRILAQVIGAAATVTLGIAGRMRGGAAPEPPAAPSARPSRVASLTSGATVSIAVLPLENFSGDARQDYFADGMTEQLITDLAQTGGLRVISRKSSMSPKDQRKPLPEIALELGVDLVVEGSASRSGDRIRVTAQPSGPPSFAGEPISRVGNVAVGPGQGDRIEIGRQGADKRSALGRAS